MNLIEVYEQVDNIVELEGCPDCGASLVETPAIDRTIYICEKQLCNYRKTVRF